MTSQLIKIIFISLVIFPFCESCRVEFSINDEDQSGSESWIPSDLADDTEEEFDNKTIQALGETGIGFSGVDLLLVIDSSLGMNEEQRRFATDVYALVTSFTKPSAADTQVENVRVAVVSTNSGSWDTIGLNEVGTETCDSFIDGRFGEVETNEIFLADGLIDCDETNPRQCPVGWFCEAGVCKTQPMQNAPIQCNFETRHSWIETTSIDPDPLFAEKAACLTVRNELRCSGEQQLESMLQALYQNPEYVEKNHLLVILVLSNKDDCNAPESGSDTSPCNAPDRYFDELNRIKGDRPSAVLFTAAVGAPLNSIGSNIPISIGDPELLSDQVCVQSWPPYAAAYPGRRFIETASLFKDRGYIQSICESSFLPMVDYLKTTIGDTMSKGQCLLSDALETEPAEDACPSCVQSRCEMYVEIVRVGDTVNDHTCPKELVFGDDYLSKAAIQKNYDGDKLTSVRLFCPVEKMPAPLACIQTDREAIGIKKAGWMYCENSSTQENSEYACIDGIDDDADGVIDCGDEDCSKCMMCGAFGSTCDLGCKYDIAMTPTAKGAASGNNVFLECPYR